MIVTVTNPNITAQLVNFTVTDPPNPMTEVTGKVVGIGQSGGGTIMVVVNQLNMNDNQTAAGSFQFPDQAFAMTGSQWRFSLTIENADIDTQASSQILTVV